MILLKRKHVHGNLQYVFNEFQTILKHDTVCVHLVTFAICFKIILFQLGLGETSFEIKDKYAYFIAKYYFFIIPKAALSFT